MELLPIFIRVACDKSAGSRPVYADLYFVATVHLAFTKYEKICDLGVRHGVELSDSYRNRNACKDFIHSISESMKQNVATTVSSARFFSILMDGSTDASNTDDELFLVMWGC